MLPNEAKILHFQTQLPLLTSHRFCLHIIFSNIKTLSIIMLSIFSRMNLFEFNGGAVTFIIYKNRFDDTTYFNTYNLISFIVY